MLKLASSFINAQEISAPEAVYSLLSLKQSMSSEKCSFINSGPKELGTKKSKAKKRIEIVR